MSKRNPTKSQRAVMELLDQGLPIEQIAYSLGKSVLAVTKQLNRIKRPVREGRIDPSPLPIERAASERASTLRASMYFGATPRNTANA